MEIEYRVVKLTFNSGVEWSNPSATVRIALVDTGPPSVRTPSIELTLPLIGIVPDGSDPAHVATAALKAAKSLLNESQLADYVRLLAEEDVRQDAARVLAIETTLTQHLS